MSQGGQKRVTFYLNGPYKLVSVDHYFLTFAYRWHFVGQERWPSIFLCILSLAVIFKSELLVIVPTSWSVWSGPQISLHIFLFTPNCALSFSENTLFVCCKIAEHYVIFCGYDFVLPISDETLSNQTWIIKRWYDAFCEFGNSWSSPCLFNITR